MVAIFVRSDSPRTAAQPAVQFAVQLAGSQLACGRGTKLRDRREEMRSPESNGACRAPEAATTSESVDYGFALDYGFAELWRLAWASSDRCRLPNYEMMNSFDTRRLGSLELVKWRKGK